MSVAEPTPWLCSRRVARIPPHRSRRGARWRPADTGLTVIGAVRIPAGRWWRDEMALANNRAAFERLKLRHRALVDRRQPVCQLAVAPP
jgi:hypothetical protein